MSDIVEKLRLLAAVDNCQASLEAADEIERLRAALRDMLRLVEDDEDDPAPYLIDVVCDRARAALEGRE